MVLHNQGHAGQDKTHLSEAPVSTDMSPGAEPNLLQGSLSMTIPLSLYLK
jgi:hypothetical protein